MNLSLPAFCMRVGVALGAVAIWGLRICAAQEPGPARWESAIAAFEHQDQEALPAPGGILFVGSSSIRRWDLQQSFPDRRALNRGFGGSEVADALHYADRIILPYRPRIVVVYAGDNDIARGTTPCEVYANFKQLVSVIHERLPETRIVYIAIKPSPKRWELVHRARAANALIKAECLEHDRLAFVDVDTPMIGDDGQPRGELFVEDKLHLSDAGYELWTQLVRPHLVE